MLRKLIVIAGLLLSLTYANSALSNSVTLKEKIGQMIIVGFTGTELHPDDIIVNAIMEQHIGGVVLYGADNIRSPEQLRSLSQQLQAYAKQAAINHKNKLYPLLIGIDYEGGKINPLTENLGFPLTLPAAIIGKGSYQQAEKVAEQMASTLQHAGINLNFSPVVDININNDNPVIHSTELMKHMRGL